MTLPFTIPAWMPGWLFLALAIPALLWFLAFLMVPFNVFGVKARLETLENQLEDLNEQVRVMQLRAAGTLAPTQPVRNASSYDDLPNFAQLKRSRAEPAALAEEPAPSSKRPPIPTPQPRQGLSNRESRDAMVPRERPSLPPRPRRTEPRLD